LDRRCGVVGGSCRNHVSATSSVAVVTSSVTTAAAWALATLDAGLTETLTYAADVRDEARIASENVALS
jgi:hypothetical protein